VHLIGACGLRAESLGVLRLLDQATKDAESDLEDCLDLLLDNFVDKVENGARVTNTETH
jgi:hypothetical protein